MKTPQKFYLILLFFLSIALLPLFSADFYNYAYQENSQQILLSPSTEHLLGTDNAGRDFLSRLFLAISISLWMGISINLLGLFLGVILALWLFLLPKKLGMTFVESLLAIPFFVLGGILSMILGTSIPSLITGFGLMMALPYAYMLQSYIHDTWKQDFIIISQSIGKPRWWIVQFHMIPIFKQRLWFQSLISLHSTIFALASMTFLGFGLQDPIPEWGSLIYSGLPYITTHPILMLAPFLCFIALSYIIYILSRYHKPINYPLYPEFSVKHQHTYIIAQVEIFHQFIKNSIKYYGHHSIILEENYYHHFPQAYRIKEFFQDILEKKYDEILIIQYFIELKLNKEDFYKYPQELSGGMLQRISLILAISQKPDFLALQSPVSSVNPELKGIVLHWLLSQPVQLFIVSPYLDVPKNMQDQFSAIYRYLQGEYTIHRDIPIHIQKLHFKQHLKPLIHIIKPYTQYNIPAIEKQEFIIYQEEILGIVGESGIGKTTLAKILTNLIPFTSQPNKMHHTHIKTMLVAQDPFSFNQSLTCKQILMEFLPTHQHKNHFDFASTLKILELDPTILNKTMLELSKGIQYQILLLRAVLYKPQLLVIDELLDHIPFEKYQKVIDLLEQLRLQDKMSIVLISHQQELLYSIVDRKISLTNNNTP